MLTMNQKDYYAILGVPKNAPLEKIKKAYRQKALALHPDQHQGDKEIEEKFKEITNAYEILSNEEKRIHYDQFGGEEVEDNTKPYETPSMYDIMKIFQQYKAGFGGGKHYHTPYNYYQSERNIRINILLNSEESITGVHRQISLQHYVTCQDCNGNGSANGSSLEACTNCHETGIDHAIKGFLYFFFDAICEVCDGYGKKIKKHCKECDGEGRKNIREKIDIKLLPDIGTGITLVMRGKGNVTIRGGMPGDLYISVKKESSQQFLKKVNTFLATMIIGLVGILCIL